MSNGAPAMVCGQPSKIMDANASPETTFAPLENRAVDTDQPQVFRKQALGISLIILVACIWVASSQLIQAIFDDLSFDKPYFLTYFNTCGFSLWLLGALSREWGAELRDWGRLKLYLGTSMSITPLWMLSNYLFNVSLDHTSVASNSVLSSTSTLWTLVFSICLLGEVANPLKGVAVAFAVGGSALVAYSDSHRDNDKGTWAGDALSLVAAAMYGLYSVALKYKSPEGSAGLSMPLLFGLIGLFVLTLGWPVLILLHAAEVEEFSLPSLKVLGFLALNALVGSNLSDVLWAQALQLTTPLVATLGLSLTVPIGMVSDMVMHGRGFGMWYIVGSLLVTAGFSLGCAAEELWHRLEAS